MGGSKNDNLHVNKSGGINKGAKSGNHVTKEKGSTNNVNISGHNKSTKGNNTKHRNTGKSIASSSKFNDTYALLFPNALPVKQVLWGLYPLNKVWRQCSIVYARPKNKSLNDINLIFPLNVNKNDILNKIGNENPNNNIMKESDYDYYVHWEKFDRRLDCWISHENLRLLNNEPNDEYPIIKNTEDNYDSDHEHDGIFRLIQKNIKILIFYIYVNSVYLFLKKMLN